MIGNCEMELERPNGVYQSGDVIAGRVVLTLCERQLIKAISFKISGYASTQWEVLTPKKQRKTLQNGTSHGTVSDLNTTAHIEASKIVYTNRQDYLATTNYFVGSEEAFAKIFELGTYAYSFAVRLPDNCPSTFDGTIGSITYEAVVLIDYPDRQETCCSRTFLIERPLDLRDDLALAQAFDVDVIEKKPYVKFWQQPLQLKVNLPQRGYVAGECISVLVKLLNDDNLMLSEIVYKLNLLATYVGQSKKKSKIKTERRTLVQVMHVLCQQRSAGLVQHLQLLHVPHTTPTIDVELCKCLQVAYEVEVTVSTTNKKRWLQAKLPIQIGTISLRSNLHSMSRTLSASAAALPVDYPTKLPPLDSTHQHYEATAPTLDPLPNTPNFAPTFRVADFMRSTNLNKNAKHNMSMDQLDFKPKYLYYEMDQDVQDDQITSTTTANENS